MVHNASFGRVGIVEIGGNVGNGGSVGFGKVGNEGKGGSVGSGNVGMTGKFGILG